MFSRKKKAAKKPNIGTQRFGVDILLENDVLGIDPKTLTEKTVKPIKPVNTKTISAKPISAKPINVRHEPIVIANEIEIPYSLVKAGGS